MSKRNREKDNNTSNSIKQQPALRALPANSIFDFVILLTLGLGVAFSMVIFDKSCRNAFPIPKLLYFGIPTSLAFLALAYKTFASPAKELWIRCAPLALPVLGYGVFSALATLTSIVPVLSFFGVYTRFHGLLSMLLLVMLYFSLTAVMTRREHLDHIVKFLVISGLLMGIYSLMQFQNKDCFDWVSVPHMNTPATSGNSNLSGNILSLLLPLCLYYTFFAVHKAWRSLAALSSFFIMVGIITARTRAVWLAVLTVAIGAFVLAMQQLRHQRQAEENRRRILLIKGLFVGLVFLLQFVLGSCLLARQKSPILVILLILVQVVIFLALQRQHELTGINFRNAKLLYASVTVISLIATASLFYSVIPARVREGNKPRTGSWLQLYYYTFYLEKNPRFFLIRDGFKVAGQHFWLGSGPGTFRLTFAPSQSLDHAQVEPNGLYDSPHNNYLYILCTRGIFTLGVYLGILILILKGGWKMLQRPQQVPLQDRFLAMALMSSMGIYLIWSLASFDSLSTLPTTFALFALFSCLYASHFPWVPSERWQKGFTWATRIFTLAMIPLALAGIYYPYKIYEADRFFNLAKSARLATGRVLADNEMGKAARLHDATVKFMKLATQANPYESSYYLEWMECNLEIYDHTADPRYVEDIMSLRERAYRHSWIPQKINHSMMRYYAMQKNIPAAIAEGEQALNYTPHSTPLLNHLGKLYLMQNTERSLSQARESFDHVLRVDPKNEEALMAEAAMALKNSQFQLAGELAIRSGERPPTNTEKIKKFLQLVEHRSNAFNALPAKPQTTNTTNAEHHD